MMNKQSITTAPKPFVFVLMPFDSQFDDIYKFGIKGAAEDAGAYAERFDEQIYKEGILERIYNQISKADVIVADMTGRNANVFYEVGYAHALGKIVLLLTQNADDIPFDLKHMQHTVYGGSIDKLRRELGEKLVWAISESQRKGKQNVIERFLVSVEGREVPEERLSTQPPVLNFISQADYFSLSVCVRNGSLETTLSISHIYLLTTCDSPWIPCYYNPDPDTTFRPLRRRTLDYQLVRPYLVPLDTLDPNPIDLEQGLSKQYRLRATIPALPPGAIDKFSFNLVSDDDVNVSEGLLKLRVHSLANSYDYPFRLSVEIKREMEMQEITEAKNDSNA